MGIATVLKTNCSLPKGAYPTAQLQPFHIHRIFMQQNTHLYSNIFVPFQDVLETWNSTPPPLHQWTYMQAYAYDQRRQAKEATAFRTPTARTQANPHVRTQIELLSATTEWKISVTDK